MVLHEGSIAEMRTRRRQDAGRDAGVYLNALAGQGVHVVPSTITSPGRDSEWMGQIYRFRAA